MAHIILTFLFLLFTFSITTKAEPHLQNTSANFIEQQCQGTLHYQLCIRCLSKYINSTTPTPAEIARIALLISLVKARYARSYINQEANRLKTPKGKEYQAVLDCLAQITDGVDQIAHSVQEFGRISAAGESDFYWHRSNVQTWLSTASTEALACMDEFSGDAIDKKTKTIIRAKVLNVAQLTSNALALVNRFVERQRATRVINKP